ncbi:Small ribosomal subunit biogenesis GTPase RsgA [Gammaproteobacteria bacterium]
MARRLTQRQQGRVARLQEGHRQRLANQVDQGDQGGQGIGVSDADPGAGQTGTVVVRHGRSLVVRDSENHLVPCDLRQNLGYPVCGDQVVWYPLEAGRGVVSALLPRRSLLVRPDYAGREKPLAANVDCLAVVLAPEPAPSFYLLDQYLVAAAVLDLSPLLVINKSDCLQGLAWRDFLLQFSHYQRLGYPLCAVSSHHTNGLATLIPFLITRTAILVGQSGVGKSSLIKALLPDLLLQIGALSAATGLGRHTTSATTHYRLSCGGALIDSPGVRGFQGPAIKAEELIRGFPELMALLGRCRFNDCRHGEEPGCALKASVAAGEVHPQRLIHYRHMLEQTSQKTSQKSRPNIG